MRITPEIQSAELPAIFRRLFAIAPWNLWRARLDELKTWEKQNRHLHEYLDERYGIERSLGSLMDYRHSTGRYPLVVDSADVRLHTLYSFASTLVRIHQRLTPSAQERLSASIGGYLRSEHGLAPLALELDTAVHLWQAGYDIEFTDLENIARFDLLARKDGLELEVDCKTASGDVGRPVHRRRALELFSQLEPRLDPLLQIPTATAIRIRVPAELRGNHEYMRGILDLASAAIKANANCADPAIASIHLSTFSTAGTGTDQGRALSREEMAALSRQVFGSVVSDMIVLQRPDSRAVVLAMVESAKPAAIVKGIYRQLKHSAENQFSGQRPALLATRLTEINDAQLRQLGDSGPDKGLSGIAQRLFTNPKRHHLVGVAFVTPASALHSSGGILGIPPTLVNQGTGLLFRRHEHPLANDPRLNFFSAQ